MKCLLSRHTFIPFVVLLDWSELEEACWRAPHDLLLIIVEFVKSLPELMYVLFCCTVCAVSGRRSSVVTPLALTAQIIYFSTTRPNI